MSLNYRAAVLHQSGVPLAIERVSAAPLGPTDVIVKIRAAGLCHTDLEVMSGSLRYPLPMILGHEAAGIVQRVGSADSPLEYLPRRGQISGLCLIDHLADDGVYVFLGYGIEKRRADTRHLGRIGIAGPAPVPPDEAPTGGTIAV